MDISTVYYSLISLFQLSLSATVICFIVYKILNLAFAWLRKEKKISWIKSALVLNFVFIFVLLLLAYVVPFLLTNSTYVPFDEEVQPTIVEYLIYFFTQPLLRIIVASIILGIFLLFFEFVGNVLLEYQKKRKYSHLLKEFVAIFVTCAIFIILLLFVFSWAPLGLFVYIFYGKINEAPLLILSVASII